MRICNWGFGIHKCRTGNNEVTFVFAWQHTPPIQSSDKDYEYRQETNTAVLESAEIKEESMRNGKNRYWSKDNLLPKRLENSGDFKSYHRITLDRWRNNSYLCNLISSTHESRNGRRCDLFLFIEDRFISQRKYEREEREQRWLYFLSKKRNYDPGSSCRISLSLRSPMYIYMNL